MHTTNQMDNSKILWNYATLIIFWYLITLKTIYRIQDWQTQPHILRENQHFTSWIALKRTIV